MFTDAAVLVEDTIVLFTSDHGNCIGTHGQVSKNNHYEESMRVPFLVRWPDKIPARQDDLLISTPDLFPTILDLMGFAAEIPQDVEGISRASLFLDDEGIEQSATMTAVLLRDRHAQEAEVGEPLR